VKLFKVLRELAQEAGREINASNDPKARKKALDAVSI